MGCAVLFITSAIFIATLQVCLVFSGLENALDAANNFSIKQNHNLQETLYRVFFYCLTTHASTALRQRN
jgi:hypothetical protein